MPSEYSEQKDSEDTVSARVEGQAPKQRNLDSSIVSKWEAFFQETEYLQKIREVSDLYPEVRSINVVYADLDKADIELAVYLLEHPDLAIIAGKEAVRNLMHQEKRKSEINLRVTALPRDSRVEIRELRSKHVGKMISVEGLVRKATEVRPKITAGLFQCLRCGTVIKEQQEGLFFKEPMECYKDQNGCGRSAGSTKFKLLTDESKFVDTQKIEIQESPEGLRGGAQPERLVGYLEDDITGLISPGDRIILNGILRSVQKGQPTKSTLFDINMDIISAEHQQREYEEISIDPEDEREIFDQAKSPDLFKKIVASISPTIYGYDIEKEAIALQLFSGVPKVLDDGTRIRGDIHILLVGDPGVAKCVTGDTEVWLADCSTRKIKEIVDEAIDKGDVNEVDDGVWAPIDLGVLTFTNRGKMEPGRAVRAWKRKAPKKMIRVKTEKGRTLTVTPTHMLFVGGSLRISPIKASEVPPGMGLVCATGLACEGFDDTYGWKRGFEFDSLTTKEEVDSEEEWVYDLEVEETHKFVANGLLSHNSQLLRYMSSLAPRGIYASGKSSSAAGLCVSPETIISTGNGEVEIGEFVDGRMHFPQEIKPSHWSQSIDGQTVKTISSDGRPTSMPVTSIWKIKTPSFLVELVENSGKRLTVTPETPLRCKPDGQEDRWVKASDIAPGQMVLVHATTSNGTPEGFGWSRIKEKRNITANLPSYVYDLTVDGSHSFIGNGFVVHNTAAAVKDEFGEGRWTLEAGALVLADKGLCLIDELDKMSDQDRSAMHEAMEAQCYDDQTEVLTNHGWKFFKDLHINDLVASLAEENRIVYSKPSMYFEAEYQGDMFYIQSRQLDLAVTPNHNMYISLNKRADDWTPFELLRMDELASKWHFKFKKNGVWEGQEIKFFRVPSVIKLLNQRNVGVIEPGKVFEMDDWLEFLGYFLSEGSVQYQNGVPYGVHISQAKDPQKIARIESCIQRLGLKYSYIGHNFDINSKQLATYLGKFGGSHDKYVPRELMGLSPRQLRILFNALMLGDGHRNERTHHSVYGTSSKRLADDVQEIAFKMGKAANICIHNPGKFVSMIGGRQIRYLAPHYFVSIIDGNGTRNINEPAIFGSDKKNIKRLPYKGKIYCVQVPNHVLYVRRGGKPVWCGNSISVAKAGITATLQCRCSILGAANPKYGRFEEHQYIADQINLPPALMSRFDLIFVMTDKPDAVKDANLTDHILQAHRRGQVRKYADPSEITSIDADKIIEDTNTLKPVFNRDFFRKYAAFSKRINPVLSDDATKIIREYYLRIRKMGEGEGSSVPITARQLEAFVRLSEASARARLSQAVTKEDAERAVRIVDYYLRKIAGEAGKLDIDIITSGTSHSQREQITILRQLISDLSDPKRGVSADELVKASEAKGISEDRVKTLVKRLSQNGEIFSPSSGYYKLTSEG